MNNQAINEIIKQARKSKGLTQQDLANQSGLSLRTIQRMERGMHEISGYSLKQISIILQIPIENMVMSNVESITIKTTSIESIKKLYWLSLFGILGPIFAFLIPAIAGYLHLDKNELYKKHYRFILIFHSIIPILQIFMYSVLVYMSAQKQYFGTQELIIFFIYGCFFNIIYFLVSLAVALFRMQKLTE